MILGVIYCCYAMPDYIEESLYPWLQAGIPVSVVSYPFVDFPEQDNEPTLKILTNTTYYKSLININTDKVPVTESFARNRGLKDLYNDCENFICWDSDEVITRNEIEKLINYLCNPDVSLNPIFRINFKNIIGDGSKWYDDFDPTRIFRKNCGNLTLQEFYYDNDVLYKDWGGRILNNLPVKHIPKSVIFPKHYSWLNNERSKKKIEYQIKHFGQGNPNACSFKWNNETNSVELNDEYFRLTGKEKLVIKDL